MQVNYANLCKYSDHTELIFKFVGAIRLCLLFVLKKVVRNGKSRFLTEFDPHFRLRQAL